MAEQRFDEQIQMSPSTSPGNVPEAGTGLGADISAGAGTVGTESQGLSSQDVQSRVQQGKDKLMNYGRDVYQRARQSVSQIPDQSRNLISSVDQQARTRPWLLATIFGASTLIIGYALGRRLRFSSPMISQISAEDIEDYT